MAEILLLVVCFLLIVLIILVTFSRPKGSGDNMILQNKMAELQSSLLKIETGLKDDFRTNREENSAIAKDNRSELSNTVKEFKSELTETLKTITEQNQKALDKLNSTLEQKITSLIEKTESNLKLNREELTKNITDFSTANILQLDKISIQVQEKLKVLNEQAQKDNIQMREVLEKVIKEFGNSFDKNVKSFNDLQREKFSQLETKQNDLVNSTEKKLDIIKNTVEEKLEKTLSERLGQSFETVGRQLIEVQKGLGEMQTLAQDVGGLKKVLSNVKMRGGIGEIQLAMLLEQILAPDQYQANVKTKSSSNEMVEFAIKLPGRDDNNQQVWLPVDAKFPKDIYEQLQTAYDVGDIGQIELAQKNLDLTIKKMAKDICEKYIDPPNTTDFAIMFLPFEGIYAEVVRKASLLEDLQRNCKVIVTGPTTLAAILNSLQMGFKTLAIQKRSSEVWQVLGAVKKEFESFGGILSKAQNNIQSGLNQLDDVMGRRTRAIQRKLKGVEALSEAQTKLIMDLPDDELLDDGADN
jgi:DNA recombination protein RmuC